VAQLLDQIGLEQQRLGFGRGSNDLDRPRSLRSISRMTRPVSAADPGVEGKAACVHFRPCRHRETSSQALRWKIDDGARSGPWRTACRSRRDRPQLGLDDNRLVEPPRRHQASRASYLIIALAVAGSISPGGGLSCGGKDVGHRTEKSAGGAPVGGSGGVARHGHKLRGEIVHRQHQAWGELSARTPLVNMLRIRNDVGVLTTFN